MDFHVSLPCRHSKYLTTTSVYSYLWDSCVACTAASIPEILHAHNCRDQAATGMSPLIATLDYSEDCLAIIHLVVSPTLMVCTLGYLGLAHNMSRAVHILV